MYLKIYRYLIAVTAIAAVFVVVDWRRELEARAQPGRLRLQLRQVNERYQAQMDSFDSLSAARHRRLIESRDSLIKEIAGKHKNKGH